jgi:hypothetical protein
VTVVVATVRLLVPSVAVRIQAPDPPVLERVTAPKVATPLVAVAESVPPTEQRPEVVIEMESVAPVLPFVSTLP